MITRRRVTADMNAAAAIGPTSSLPIDPEGDQEADPGTDIKEVTPGTEGAQGIHLCSSRRHHSSRKSRS